MTAPVARWAMTRAFVPLISSRVWPTGGKGIGRYVTGLSRFAGDDENVCTINDSLEERGALDQNGD